MENRNKQHTLIVISMNEKPTKIIIHCAGLRNPRNFPRRRRLRRLNDEAVKEEEEEVATVEVEAMEATEATEATEARETVGAPKNFSFDF